MSELFVNKKNIYELLTTKKAMFLIPDYQRAYAWKEDHCQTLWDDLVAFCIPDDDYEKFDTDEEYYLGSIVSFKNNNVFEIIDGQQRITTLMLLLRAFYESFKLMQDKSSKNIKTKIEACIWKINEEEEADMDELKINSEVASDEDKDEFLFILKNGIVKPDMSSKYAENYRFFQNKIKKYKEEYPTCATYLIRRILNNCILLPIEAQSQETALRIFSTLNDRGMPLSDSDIFKSQFYYLYKSKGKMEEFNDEWKKLQERCKKIFKNDKGKQVDELFTRYMYYERAKKGTRDTSTIALKKFYENNKYELLHKEETFNNLIALSKFWEKVYNLDNEYFNFDVLKHLTILNYAPNSIWTYLVTVYFFAYRDENNKLDMEKFANFLNKTIGFIWSYQISKPGLINLRFPIYTEMINLLAHKEAYFSDFILYEKDFIDEINDYLFTNNRLITRSMLIWWAYQNPNQKLIDPRNNFHVEHIYPKQKNKINPLSDERMIDNLGNKSLLESELNVRASDYMFENKKKYYLGEIDDEDAHPTIIADLIELTKKDDFTEEDLLERDEIIIYEFIDYLKENSLLTDKKK